MARVVIPGGTGYLGRALARRLVDRGDDVVILTRGASRAVDDWRVVNWDANTLGDWVEEIEGADAIVHLNGRRVDTRATDYLGHSDPGFTLRVYTHLMPSSEDRARTAMDKALRSAIENPADSSRTRTRFRQ